MSDEREHEHEYEYEFEISREATTIYDIMAPGRNGNRQGNCGSKWQMDGRTTDPVSSTHTIRAP